ncbi:MAG: 5'-methylthioadenosine/adenosylhomocysteine nucleosidase [Anaerorhabdus sp.]
MIAFIGAMESEVQALVKMMSDVKHQVHRHLDFYIGTIAGKECVVMKSGVAKIAAAMSTTVLLENFEVEIVVNIGTAGGLHPDMKVLDVVIAKQVTCHDLDVPGWEKGFDDEERCYYSDQKLLDVMHKITGDDQVWIGNMVTGDIFVCRDEQIKQIKKNYPNALCAEMEAAAIGQVCTHYQKPFLVIRSLSDIAYQDNNQMTFYEYEVRASERSANWCVKFVEAI